MDNNLTVRIAQPPGVNVSLSAPGTLYAKSLNYLDFVFSTGVETPNAIVKRDANGLANFTTARTVAGAAAIYATATGASGTFAVEASGTNGSGAVAARSISGAAALLTSGSGVGAQINSNTGSDIASFQNASSTVLAVERVDGILRWIKNGYAARLTPATLTAACTWTLPDGGGAIAVNLGNVNNTSDANKPVSTAQQTALNLKAPLVNPSFTGSVTSSGAISTSGESSSISTYGGNATIFTQGVNASIFTQGPSGHIFTQDSGAHIQSYTFKLFNGEYATTLSHSATADRAIAFPNKAGTIALTSDITGTNSGTNTGDQDLTSLAADNSNNILCLSIFL
jgi:hypothetical protein